LATIDLRLLAAIDEIDAGFAVFDSQLRLHFCNACYAPIRGYPPKLCQPGTTLAELFRFNALRGDYGPGDTSHQVAERIGQISAGFPIEVDQELGDGRILEARYRPLADGGLATTYRDVTELRRTAAALREEGERHELVSEAVSEGIYDWNIASNTLGVSDRLNQLFNFARNELTASDWAARVHPDDMPAYSAAMRQHFSGKTPVLSAAYRIRDKTGAYRWVEDRAKAIRNDAGRAVRLVGAIDDITSRKEAEQALQASEERYALAMSAINEGLYDFDLDRNQVFYSPSVHRALGFTAAEMSTPEDWIDRIHPEDLPLYRKAMAAHLRGEAPRFVCEIRYFHSDGTLHWARQHGTAVRDARGRVIRLVGSTGDITAEKTLAAELDKARIRLSESLESISQGFALFDAEDRLLMCNGTYHRFFAVSADPEVAAMLVPGMKFEDYVRKAYEKGMYPDAGPDLEAYIQARLAKRRAGGAFELRMRDGTWLYVTERRTHDGGLVAIYTDISDAKRRETQLQAARDAAEAALERQTATADILKVIASSPSDTRPAFDSIAESSNRLLGGLSTAVWRFEGNKAYLAAFTATSPEGDEALKALSPMPIAELDAFVQLSKGQIAQIPDTEDGPTRIQALARLRGYRAMVFVPLMTKGGPIGLVSVTRKEAGAFAPDDVQLLQTFADQAVIAIQNARLFDELTRRTGELEESLEQQTATSEILRAISQSPTDVQPVLNAVVKAAVRFCGAIDAVITLREGDGAIFAAHEGPLITALGSSLPLNRETAPGRAILDGRTCHLPDIASLDTVEFAAAHRFAAAHGFHAAVAAPLLHKGIAIGSVALRKPEPGAFTLRQIELLETFAAQAVIAIENVRLFTELRDSLERLRAAQANLVQSEKMASLGQLTAGIAHEIKNPLNFVNNFASLSVELLAEIKEVAAPAFAQLDEDKRAEIDETMALITGNLAKIAEHGRRADGIVKSMLSHSRGGTGDWQAADINALVEEALNLAYHSARAHDKNFNITLERDLPPASKPIEVVPQDVTRVFLNLFGNGLYAANKRRLAGTDIGFKPLLRVSTRDLGEMVEIKVRDNGTGIPDEVRAKLFQPFFTTKPTGEGTGLGLSISYDIVTQQHGGTVEVESEVGSFTEFTVRLPRSRRVAPAERTG
jgi:PAS domain S-box-containing protein